MKPVNRVIWHALLLLFYFGPAPAQSYRGTVRGSVIDQTQAAVVNATVTLINKNTGVRTTRETSQSGLYVFDLVDAGMYTVTVEYAGFGKYTQENISVQSGGDVTVNATLSAGALQQNVTVTERPPAVEFNSASRDITIDTKMANDTPRIDRNPFKLTLIAPSAVNARTENQPYHSWAANSVDLGGGTNLANDLLVDGSPVGLGQKNSYPPNTDAVQEVIVSTNSVDGQSGHSAGGVISITTKSGTNDFHGLAFYLGRYPWLNALANRTTNSLNSTRQNMMGGTFGNPIIKNKLFNFFSLEYWKVGSPASYQRTVPTPLERAGDFSQTRSRTGGARTIYDPYSSVLVNGVVNRSPFPGNVIAASRMDPLSVRMMQQFWDPNGPGADPSGLNNFQAGYVSRFDYLNFSDRVDYVINDKFRISGHYGRYHTDNIDGNPTPNQSSLYVPVGTLRGADQASADLVYAVSPSTVVNVHGSWDRVIDAYVSQGLGNEGWSSIWPGNNWYSTYQNASVGQPVYYPSLNIGGQAFGGPGFYWDQRPSKLAFSGQVSHQKGSHYFKFGFDFRGGGGFNVVTGRSTFYFPQNMTAQTTTSPDLINQGSQFASFLLGGLDNQTQMIGGPSPNPRTEFYGMYFNDEWKLTRNVTLTFGLRNEYETAWHDPEHNFSRGLDLNSFNTVMNSNPVAQPAAVTNIVGPNYWRKTGAWRFTDSQHPGMWSPQALALQPRFGVAVRINDRTALRGGYSLYTVPTEYNFSPAPISGFEAVGFLQPPFFGQTGYQYAAPLLQGRPQVQFSDPYPANNPLIPINGKRYGENLGLGGDPLFWYPENFQKAYNNRMNISLQRQLPGEIVATIGFFANFGNRLYTRSLNIADPNLQVANFSQLNTNVANPFYNFLTPDVFPGSLRNQPTVPLSTLLKPYPQYGGLFTLGNKGSLERYYNIEAKVQKRFSGNYNLFASYVYIRERVQQYFNEVDQYNDRLTWQDSDQPRHRFTGAGTVLLPIGKGQRFFGGMPRAIDAIVGGWQVTGLATFSTGSFLRFGNLIANGNPCVANPSPQRWFDTGVFSRPPTDAYTIRSNPYQYNCLTGPKFFTLDATVLKGFQITERVRTELKVAAYNATNKLNRGNPVTDINNSLFGQAIYQGAPGGTLGAQSQEQGNLSGRQVEIGMRLIF